ncbi:MAG: KGK domain-containing protein [Halothece sp.]
MEEQEQYRKIEWEEDDVIAFSQADIKNAGFILESLEESIQYDRWGQNLTQNLSSNLNIDGRKIVQGNNSDRFVQWFDEGIDCKIMRAYDAKGWRNGKIRLKLNIEFELWEEREDESESPLDHFRDNQL